MLKIGKFTDVYMTGSIMHTPSHTDWFLIRLAYSNLFEFLFALILEKGLFLDQPNFIGQNCDRNQVFSHFN